MFVTPASTCPMKDRSKALLFINTFLETSICAHAKANCRQCEKLSFVGKVLHFHCRPPLLKSCKNCVCPYSKYLSKFLNVLVQIVKCICTPCEMYLYILWTNCEMYLYKSVLHFHPPPPLVKSCKRCISTAQANVSSGKRKSLIDIQCASMALTQISICFCTSAKITKRWIRLVYWLNFWRIYSTMSTIFWHILFVENIRSYFRVILSLVTKALNINVLNMDNFFWNALEIVNL